MSRIKDNSFIKEDSIQSLANNKVLGESGPLELSIPVAVVLSRRIITGKFWSHPQWSLNSVVSGQHITARQSRYQGLKTADTDEGEQFLWSGYSITLYRDACERYWHALIGDKPSVYVVCRDLEGDEDNLLGVEPASVTLDYDEAIAYAETDSLVLSCEISPELYQIMERFVLENYKPQAFKKRKRKNWSEDERSQPQASSDPPRSDELGNVRPGSSDVGDLP